MILSYTFPFFEAAIPAGLKGHSFRRDPTKRWRAGLSIQHYMGSPRNPKSNPRKFWENECTRVQEAKIIRTDGTKLLPFKTKEGREYNWHVHELVIILDNQAFIDDNTLPIITYDGLSVQEFHDFFVPKPGDEWEGRLIHWTNVEY